MPTHPLTTAGQNIPAPPTGLERSLGFVEPGTGGALCRSSPTDWTTGAANDSATPAPRYRPPNTPAISECPHKAAIFLVAFSNCEAFVSLDSEILSSASASAFKLLPPS